MPEKGRKHTIGSRYLLIRALLCTSLHSALSTKWRFNELWISGGHVRALAAVRHYACASMCAPRLARHEQASPRNEEFVPGGWRAMISPRHVASRGTTSRVRYRTVSDCGACCCPGLEEHQTCHCLLLLQNWVYGRVCTSRAPVAVRSYEKPMWPPPS